jgi:hypothetical protein
MILNDEGKVQAGNDPIPFSFSREDVEGYISDCIALQTKWAQNNNFTRKYDLRKLAIYARPNGETFPIDVISIGQDGIKFKCEEWSEDMDKLGIKKRRAYREAQEAEVG